MEDHEMAVTENSCSQQHVPMASSYKVDQQGEVDVATVAHPSLPTPASLQCGTEGLVPATLVPSTV